MTLQAARHFPDATQQARAQLPKATLLGMPQAAQRSNGLDEYQDGNSGMNRNTLGSILGLAPVIPRSPRRLTLVAGVIVTGLHLSVVLAYLYTPTPVLTQRQASAQTMEISIMSAPSPPAPVSPVTPTPAAIKAAEPAEQRPVGKPVAPVAKLLDPNAVKKAEKLKPKPEPEKPAPPAPARKPVETAKPAAKAAPAVPATPPPSQASAVKAQASAPVKNTQTEGANSDRQNWESQVLAELEAHKRYPTAALNRGQEDVIYVRISVSRDGEITDYQIVRSQGFALLDSAVKTMVRRASPLPPLPESIKGNPYVVTVPVNFFVSRR